jgi:hypothetical protein
MLNVRQLLRALAILSLAFAARTASAANPPIVKDDLAIGLRVPLGGVGGADFGLGVGAEKMIQDKIGITAAGYWSGYSEEVPFGALGAYTYSYSNLLLTVGGAYHFYQADKLDLSAGLALGYNVATFSAEWKGQGTAPDSASDAAGGFIWSATANGRYFLSDKLAAQLSLGYGLGYAAVGLDYKF